jgi:hypothetical protein
MEEKKLNIFLRILKKIWKKIEPDPILTSMQQDIFDIFESYLNDDDNVRYLEPSPSEKKYIVSKDYILNRNMDDLFIMLDSRRISIIDQYHKYDFDNKFDLHQKTIDKMNNMFNDKVEQDRENMKNDIMGNIKSSLEIILENQKKKKK